MYFSDLKKQIPDAFEKISNTSNTLNKGHSNILTKKKNLKYGELQNFGKISNT